MPRDFEFTVTVPNQRLDDFLLGELSGVLSAQVSKSKVRRLIIAGGVSLSGGTKTALRRAASSGKGRASPHTRGPSPSQILNTGQRVTARIDEALFFAEKDAGDIVYEMSAGDILYEDEWILVVNKPAGIPTDQGFVASRDHLLAATQRFLSLRDNMDEPYAGLHHRLDRDTSGIVLLTKKREANPHMHKLFSEHLIRKTYMAICAVPRGKAAAKHAENFRVENEIGRVSRKSEAAKWGPVSNGGQHALTDFRVVRRGGTGLLVEARPLTGRTHQIRVHLSGAGLPIAGDELYGGYTRVGDVTVGRVMLHATELVFTHPADGRDMKITAPFPADFRGLADRL